MVVLPSEDGVSETRNAERGRRKSERIVEWIILGAILAVMGYFALIHGRYKGLSVKTVVVYTSQDQVYAEPIFRDFEEESHFELKVLPVYDSEAVKTVGLANRLLAERDHPQCDVFWSNEEMRMIQLATMNVFRETNGTARFGYRSRRLVINTNFVRSDSIETGVKAPASLLELTNAQWKGKVALAFPQFGTTASHFHALRRFWGEEVWLAWCRALAANKSLVVDGNSVVVKLVGRGEAWIGLTDSDDVAAGQREGLPVAPLPLNKEALIIPNSVGVVRNAPHPVNADKLFEYLQRVDVREKLVKANALESTETSFETFVLEPDWESLVRDFEITTKQLTEVFLR
jgi:iron(III) transport system substrate-binding protein